MYDTMGSVAADGTVTAHDGVPIAYRDYGGSGRALVLLHGVGGNLESMDGLARRLGTGRRIITADIRFCGQSGEAERFSFADTVADIETIAAELATGQVDVAGASLGGVVAGHYGGRHPESRIVSIDGFAAGTVRHATPEDAAAFDVWAAGTRAGLEAMTAPPESGDQDWLEAELQKVLTFFDRLNYGSPHAEVEARRHFLALPDGTFRRHPARRLLDDQLADMSRSMVHMFHDCTGPTLILFCTEANWPAGLELELNDLVAAKPNIEVVRLPLTHVDPMWNAADHTAELIDQFLTSSAGGRPPSGRQAS
ncbi:alpha/beta fold hydrolase [Lentzea sp. NPDC051213]|uniref:alpha/beta fold hydrolase n=1 Tax=Lentzea sp. NPDC051213 TaxID=3364126 RepID=UPI00378FD4DD